MMDESIEIGKSPQAKWKEWKIFILEEANKKTLF